MGIATQGGSGIIQRDRVEDMSKIEIKLRRKLRLLNSQMGGKGKDRERKTFIAGGGADKVMKLRHEKRQESNGEEKKDSNNENVS